LSTAKYCKRAPEAPAPADEAVSWRSISTGLVLVEWGYGILISGGLLGPGLLWLAVAGVPLPPWLATFKADRSAVVLVGLGVLGVTALLSYGLVVGGQWRCQLFAPRRRASKQLLCIGLLTTILASTTTAVAAFQDGGQTYAALQRGEDELVHLNLSSPSYLLLAGSAALALFGSLIFSQFLRNVASHFHDRPRMQGIDFNLTCVGLLLGGSVAIMICAPRFVFRPEVLPWLAGGWFVCVVWHWLLVRSVSECVTEELLAGLEAGVCVSPPPRPAPAAKLVPGAAAMHTLSGLRRLASKADCRG
jgi:hypothetical protein